MPKSCIPGYEAELEREARLRRSAFLGLNYEICGIEIQNITPFLLARLRASGTAFLDAGEITIAETIKFLWALSPLFTNEKPHTSWYRKLLGKKPISAMRAFVEDVTKHLISIDGFDRAEDEIREFIRITFMDGSISEESVPYVVGETWMVYTFMKEPFNWTEEKAMHTPYRKLFQYLRCVKLENGIKTLINEFSDPVRDNWLHDIRSQWTASNSKGNN